MAAGGVELATAYISLSASTKGLGKDIAKEFGGPQVAKAGDKAGNSIVSRMGGVLKKGAIGAGLAAGGLLGTAIVKGFGRLNAIDQAEAKLRGLGHTAKGVDRIMANALASVKGTAFGLDEAATTAGSVVAAGIKPGKQLEGVLKTVADTATIAGTSMSDMGAIFGSVAARGKLQGDDMMQLTSKGVPVLAFLAKHYGITAKAASEMVTKGKVDFKNFAAAMHENIGGAALDSGKTVSGAWKNLWASISRTGANLLSGVFPKLQGAFTGLTKWLGPIEDKAKVVGQALGKWLGRAADAAQGLFDLFIKGDFTHAFYKAFHVSDDSDLVANLFAVRDAAIKSFGYLKDRILPTVVTGFKGLWDAAQPIVPAMVKIGKALLGIFKGAGTTAKDSGPGILAAAFSLLKGSVSGIAKVLGWVGDFAQNHTTTFQSLAVGVLAIVGAMKAWKLATLAWSAVTKIAAAVQAAFNAVMSANPIGLVVLALIGLAAGLVYAYKKSETFRNIVNAVWAGVKAMAGVVLSWFTDRFIPFFTTTIPNAFRATVSWVQRNWPVILAVITGPIGLATLFVVRHWDQITGAFRRAKDWVTGAFRVAWAGIKAYITSPISAARDNVGRILGDLKGKFRSAVDAVGKIWRGLEDKAKAPIRFVVNTVLNNGLLASFNKIAGFFGAKSNLHISLPRGFATGGYTGAGGKYQPAGIVHAGEMVFEQEAVARHGIGALESLRQGKASIVPGYSGGGLVGKLKTLAGLVVGDQKALATTGIAVSDIPRMLRAAVDSAMGGLGSSPVGNVLKAVPAKLVGMAIEKLKGIADGGGPHIGGSWQQLWSMVRARFPDEILTSAFRPGATVAGFPGVLSRHGMGKAIDIAPRKDVWDWLYGMRGRLFELLGPWGMFREGKPWHNAITAANHRDHIHLSSYAKGGEVRPLVYDQGGILPPGGMAVNLSKKPEAVFTQDQMGGMGGGHLTGTLRIVDLQRGLVELTDARIERAGRRAVGGRNF